MSTTVSKTLTYYLILSYLDKSITPLPMIFSWKIMNFSEAATAGVLWKKPLLKVFAIFTGKLQACNFFKKRLQHWCFPLNIAKFLRTPILKNICWRLLLIVQNSYIDSFFNPNQAGLFEGSFSWGEVNLTPLHISRRTYLISI